MRSAALVSRPSAAAAAPKPAMPAAFSVPPRRRRSCPPPLTSAARYSPPGAPITVAASAAGEPAGPLVVAIQDRGPGVPEGEHDLLFQPFYRGSAAGQGPGSGLGLAICKGIVEAHGGQIWVSSIAGGGSTFSFSLPTSSV